MYTKQAITALCAAILMASFTAGAPADSVTYEIHNLLPSGGPFNVPDAGQTYAGTGYLQTGANALHQNVFEVSSFYRTALNVDVSGLSDTTITNATLSFFIASKSPTDTTTATFTSFSADGVLGNTYAPPDNLGSFEAELTGGTNVFDVTALLSSILDMGEDWFGLHMSSLGSNFFTSTQGPTYTSDAAQVRLNVEYETPAPVPVPPALALGLLGLGIVRWIHPNRSNFNRVQP